MIKLVTAGVAILLVIKFISFITDDASDLCGEPGYGKTTLICQVFDKYTGRPLDSVGLTIRYGISMDIFLDTMLSQKDSIRYTFNIPEGDCDIYCMDVYRKQYWYKPEFDTTARPCLEKGQRNYITAWLTPATTVYITVERDRRNIAADTAFLYITPKDSLPLEFGDRYTVYDFKDPDSTDFQLYSIADEGTTRKITSDLPVRSFQTYKVHWIHQKETGTDTLYSEFKAIPFDTVRLQFGMPH